MKKIIFLVITFSFSCALYSQNYLGFSKNEIIQAKGIPNDSGIVQRTHYISYNNKSIGEAYYFVEEICLIYTITLKYDELNKYIETLNHQYNKIEENNWVYYYPDYQIKVHVRYNDETEIAVIMFIKYPINNQSVKKDSLSLIDSINN